MMHDDDNQYQYQLLYLTAMKKKIRTWKKADGKTGEELGVSSYKTYKIYKTHRIGSLNTSTHAQRLWMDRWTEIPSENK